MITVSETTRKKMNDVSDSIDSFTNLSKELREVIHEKAISGDSITIDTLKRKSDAIKNGEFKIVVCGRFKTGKSTFVNALLDKGLMATKAIACTAVIAVVKKGNNENQVEVFYTNGTSKKMPIDLFTNEFQLTPEEEQKVKALGENDEEIVFDRFADIDHVEMQSTHPMFQSGCSLVDTPGFEEAISRDKTTTTYLPNADAIILMLDATVPFSKIEKEFIKKNFANQHRSNVFFVINKVNLLQMGQLDNVQTMVKSVLKQCFIDEQGNFDDDLYNRRVYYVNAYEAFCARTGQDVSIFAGGRWINIPANLESTNIVDYESSMMQFINSDERNRAIFTSVLDLLVNKYKESVAHINGKLSSMAMSESERKIATKKAQDELDEANKTIEKIEKAFEKYGNTISSALYQNFTQYLERNVRGELPAHVQNSISSKNYGALNQMVDGLLNIVAYLPIESLRNKVADISAKHLKPLTDDLQQYVKSKLELWGSQSGSCIKSYSDDLNEELKELCIEFDSHIEASLDAFSVIENKKDYTWKGGLQSALAVYLGDFSTAVDMDSNGGSIGWGQIIGKSIAQGYINAACISLFGPGALLATFAIDALTVAVKASKNAQKKAFAMGDGAIAKYIATVQDEEMSFKNDIIKKVAIEKEKASQKAKEALTERKTEIESLSITHQKSESEEKVIKEKMEHIRNSMRNRIETVYSITYDKSLNESEFQGLITDNK